LSRVIHDKYVITEDLAIAVHLPTSTWRPVDGPSQISQELRGSRTTSDSTIPTSAGATKVVGKVFAPLN
ncbi:hypothetical protein FA13DRAFT_1570997, partial [Coprinellus micaceus]